MEDKFLLNGSPPRLSYRSSLPPTWQSAALEVHGDMNSCSEPLSSSFLNLGWDNSMDQSVPFHSALSSIISSPGSCPDAVPADNVVLRELIGRLGSICNNSGEISPQSQKVKGNNSLSNSCYNTPLNSPPKLNLAIDQSRGNMPISVNLLAAPHSLTHFATDPGFVGRAARFSCFGSRNYTGLETQFGLQEPELGYRSVPLDSRKLSRASSNQSLKSGVQASVLDNKEITTLSGPLQQDGSATELRSGSGSDRKPSRLSRSSTPASVDDATEICNNAHEESSASDQITGAELGSNGLNEINARKRKAIPKGKASSPSAKSSKAAEEDESKAKRCKPAEGAANEKEDEMPKMEQKNENSNAGDGNQKQTKENQKRPEPSKQDYIHVRARRGQATDNHSLAERVRREKISERMKFLQDLVPGCNKVTGKAVMLDEIINYVQSLQRQVEFLSMKLATVNPRLDFNTKGLLSKDMLQSRGPLPNMLFTLDSSASSYSYGHQPQQGLIQNTISTGSECHCSVNPLELRRTLSMQLPTNDRYADVASQLETFWDDDLQSVVQMGFGQNQETAFSLQSFHGTLPTSHMKIEL